MSNVVPTHERIRVPSPADVPTMTARELLERIRAQGGRVLRMKIPPATFCLTTNPELATWLFDRGATCFTARGLKLDGSYLRDRVTGLREWDQWIHPIPLLGDETAWEAAA